MTDERKSVGAHTAGERRTMHAHRYRLNVHRKVIQDRDCDASTRRSLSSGWTLNKGAGYEGVESTGGQQRGATSRWFELGNCAFREGLS